MNEEQWLASADPQAMLAHLRQHCNPSERKLRLFACSCCRLVWDKLTDARSRVAVAVAERYADEGEAVAKEMGRSWLYLDMEAPHEPAWLPAYAACAPPDIFLRELGRITGAVAKAVPPAAQAALLRDFFGNPFRPVAVTEEHRADDGWGVTDRRRLAWAPGPAVLSLARAAYELRRGDGLLDPERLAILSDALEEAGCDSAELLAHLRGPGPHVRGCWAVDLLLGKE